MAAGHRMDGRPESGAGAVNRVYGWMGSCRIFTEFGTFSLTDLLTMVGHSLSLFVTCNHFELL
jgi:hypothetical protein